MTEPSWGLGEYERTAAALLPAARAAVGTAAIRDGERVVDVGCGTGNAALLAAGPGRRVTAVDPARRLRRVVAREATARGLPVTVLAGTADALPLPDGDADVLLSVFGVIFAADPVAAAAEFARVAAPAGRLVLTAWAPGGPLDELHGVPLDAVTRLTGHRPGPTAFRWHDVGTMTELLAPHGFAVTARSLEITFRARSADDYWTTQFLTHPFAATFFPALDRAGLLADVRDRVLELLAKVNEDPPALAFTERYVVIEGRRSLAVS